MPSPVEKIHENRLRALAGSAVVGDLLWAALRDVLLGDSYRYNVLRQCANIFTDAASADDPHFTFAPDVEKDIKIIANILARKLESKRRMAKAPDGSPAILAGITSFKKLHTLARRLEKAEQAKKKGVMRDAFNHIDGNSFGDFIIERRSKNEPVHYLEHEFRGRTLIVDGDVDISKIGSRVSYIIATGDVSIGEAMGDLMVIAGGKIDVGCVHGHAELFAQKDIYATVVKKDLMAYTPRLLNKVDVGGRSCLSAQNRQVALSSGREYMPYKDIIFKLSIIDLDKRPAFADLGRLVMQGISSFIAAQEKDFVEYVVSQNKQALRKVPTGWK